MSEIRVDAIKTRGGASEIAIDKLKGASSASSISVVGEGGSTTTNLQQGLCKTWINFNGITGSIATRDSFNVTSISDDGTALYSVNIANDMASVNYALTLVGDDSGTRENIYCYAEAYAAGSFQLRSTNDQSSYIDCEVIGCTVQGDLA